MSWTKNDAVSWTRFEMNQKGHDDASWLSCEGIVLSLQFSGAHVVVRLLKHRVADWRKIWAEEYRFATEGVILVWIRYSWGVLKSFVGGGSKESVTVRLCWWKEIHTVDCYGVKVEFAIRVGCEARFCECETRRSGMKKVRRRDIRENQQLVGGSLKEFTWW